MSGEQYTQIKRPVGRLTEKVLGWFSWVFLLILTIVTMFIALVSFSNDTSIANLENSLNNNELVQQILGNNDLSTTQFVIWLQNGVWAIIVYFIICLLISFLALISMNIRILSGFLFLLAAIVTIPLVLLVVTLIIPILFFIVAIMMFARKDRVETVPAYYNDDYGQPYYDNYEYYDKRRPQSTSHNDYYEDGYNHGYYDDYEQPRDNKEYRNTRRKRRKERQQREAYEAEHQYEPQQHDAYMNDESESHNYDETDDKYAQFPKRAVESEYKSTQQEEEEPAIMSRQAKYNKKSKKLSVMNNSKKIIIKMKMIVTVMRMVMLTTKSHKNLKLILENLRLNARKKKLKFVRRKEKKTYNKRMKERRKNQPSAVNQRRMNYEERRQMFQGEQPQEDNQENQVEHKDDTENK